MHFDLRECLNFAEELFGGIAEAGETILIGGVNLNDVFVASRYGYTFLKSMLTDIVGHLIYLLSLETFTVAEADHEVLDDLEVL